MQKILENEWRNYAERGMGVNTPIMLRAIIRRAFYIGAQAAFVGIFTNMKDEGEGQVIDAEVINGIKAEIVDFLAEYQAPPALEIPAGVLPGGKNNG